MADLLKEYSPLPTIQRFHDSPAQMRCIVGPVGCFSGDTEFLTPQGWKKIREYVAEDWLAQWNRDTKRASFVLPDRFIKEPCQSFLYFSNQYSLSMMLSAEHRMPLYDYRGVFVVKEASEVFKNPSRYTVPTNFIPDTPEYPITDPQLRVMVMFCADGSLAAHGFKQRVVVRKERKHSRIKMLLEAAGIPFTYHPCKGRPTEIGYAFVPPIKSKRYSGWGWKLSARQLGVVVDEMNFWDGLFEGEDSRFSTTSKEDADFMQYAVHATGGRASISRETHSNCKWADGYVVHIASPGSSKATVMLRGDNTSLSEVKSEDGYKYCFEVETGFLVMRHDGRIFISGNSGKTSGAAWEVCHYIPDFLAENYGIMGSRWAVIRNTYRELADTTVRTIKDWFPWGHHDQKNDIYTLAYPDGKTVELLFRACDRVGDVSKFLSLELTGYWIDESIEVAQEVKRTLKGRIGRYPAKVPPRWGIETTNPPDVEHPTYWEFAWDTPPPGPIPSQKPLPKHVGFWQPPGENQKNLRPGYYEDLTNDYRDNPDWVARYIESKPGVIIIGKLVYNNFDRNRHVALKPLVWAHGRLIRGWDNSGNLPACVVLQIPRPKHIQVLREFHNDRMGIVDFGNWVKVEGNLAFPDAEFLDWADPAGEARYSKRDGGFTSNAELIKDECGIKLRASEQNWSARKESVETQLGLAEGLLIDPSCIRLINGFIGGYHYQEIGKTGKYNDMPDQNRFAHIHSALQYALVKIVSGSKTRRTEPIRAEMDFDPHDPFAEDRRRPRESDTNWSPFQGGG